MEGRVCPEDHTTLHILSKPEARLTCAKAMGVKLLPLIVVENIGKLSRSQLVVRTSRNIKLRSGSDSTPTQVRNSIGPPHLQFSC